MTNVTTSWVEIGNNFMYLGLGLDWLVYFFAIIAFLAYPAADPSDRISVSMAVFIIGSLIIGTDNIITTYVLLIYCIYGIILLYKE